MFFPCSRGVAKIVGAALARARGTRTEQLTARSSCTIHRGNAPGVPAIHRLFIIAGIRKRSPYQRYSLAGGSSMKDK